MISEIAIPLGLPVLIPPPDNVDPWPVLVLTIAACLLLWRVLR